jgi:hypothetical protein
VTIPAATSSTGRIRPHISQPFLDPSTRSDRTARSPTAGSSAAAAFGSMKRRIAELTALHTGQTVEQITADADRDRWFTAEEARAYGLVDAVVASPTAVR